MFEEEFKLIALNQEENLRVASNIITNLDFIEHYKDYLDWSILSSRVDLMNNPEFLERFKNNIYWVRGRFNAPWNIFWKYRDYSLKPSDNYFKLIDHYIELTKTCEEKYKILEDILQDSTEYDKEVAMCLRFPEDIDFIRKHEDRIVWNNLSIILNKEDFRLFSEFKDKIYWTQLEGMEYWIINNELLSWVWDNVRDKIDWDNAFKINYIRIPISNLRIIKSAIKEVTWTEFCHCEGRIRHSIGYLKEGITRPEHFDWYMVSEFIVNSYKYNLTEPLKFFNLEFIEKYQDYISWKKLMSIYDKSFIIRKIMPKKTRKKLGYHIWFGIIFKLEKKESTKP